MILRQPSYDLSGRNTFRMKVRCALYVEVTEEKDLELLDFASLPKPLLVLGGGSNLLFSGDFPGTVLRFAGGRDMPFQGTPFASLQDVFVTVGAGVVFDDFCAWAAEEDLWGPENLSLIPGEVGASAVQNIGAYGVEAKDIISSVRAYDLQEGRFVDIPAEECHYGYRESRFKGEWKGRFLITAVTFHLSRTPQPKLDYGGVRKALVSRGIPLPLTPKDIREVIIGIRQAKLPDPKEIGSAGSFFKNPVVSREHYDRIVSIARADQGPDAQVPHFDVGDRVKVPAAWMIDQCGFKGQRLGGAQVYPGQPLVIVNATGNASPDDIIALEERIVRTVAAKYGVTLHPEVEHVPSGREMETAES